MKQLLVTTIAVVLLVGCGESQQSAPAPEANSAEPVAEAAKVEPPTAKSTIHLNSRGCQIPSHRSRQTTHHR